MRKNKPYKPFLLAAGWLFSGLVMASGSGTLAPVVVSLANGGQANIAVSNTDPNLFTVPGAPYNWSAICAEPGRRLAHGKRPPHMNPCWLPSARQYVEVRCLPAGIRSPSRKKRCRPRPVCLPGLTLCGPAIT